MRFQVVFAALTSLVALTSAISIVDNVKFDLRAISAKSADIDNQLNKFGTHVTYLNDFLVVKGEAEDTANVIKTKTVTLKNIVGKMSREEFRTTMPLFRDLRLSISKTMKLYIAKKPTVLKVAVNPTQNIYPVAQTKEQLVSLFHLMSEFDKALGDVLPFDRVLTEGFATIRAEIGFAFIPAINAYRRG
ncbi:hypothetical protein GALMADRAFT_279262 [Galerina marginata CBS 339.88]|uniref:Uncharacterized protein n=1 Tax=Galerina marginata (strain CBS 339.88) TaxID=685588 RepID=A0A067TCT0_GALM3|nr:hypothetical protein GALMADRAFT_279262 [Galerina marginata CBS 339.88]